MLHDQGMDYSEQRVKLHEIKCKMKMFVYQIEKGNTFAWDEYEAIGDIYFIKDGDSYFENGVLNREKIWNRRRDVFLTDVGGMQQFTRHIWTRE